MNGAPAVVTRPRFLGSSLPSHRVAPARFEPPGHGAPRRSVPDEPGPADTTPDKLAPVAQAAPPAGPAPTELVERLTAAIESLRLNNARLAELARSDALEIGFLVARRILETETTTRVEPLLQLIRSAVRRAGEARSVTIRVAAADAAAIEAAGRHEDLGALAVAVVKVVPDATLARGDCVVESELGRVDGRLERRLDEVWQAVSAEVEDPT